jgi:hypothetical protein
MSATFVGVPSFLDLGAWTTHAIRPLFYLFKNDKVAPALAFSIFSVALGLCVLFLCCVNQKNRKTSERRHYARHAINAGTE